MISEPQVMRKMIGYQQKFTINYLTTSDMDRQAIPNLALAKY